MQPDILQVNQSQSIRTFKQDGVHYHTKSIETIYHIFSNKYQIFKIPFALKLVSVIATNAKGQNDGTETIDLFIDGWGDISLEKKMVNLGKHWYGEFSGIVIPKNTEFRIYGTVKGGNYHCYFEKVYFETLNLS